MERDTDAFVVWIEGDLDQSAAETLQGRVEHVQTSARASFSSTDELLRFLAGHRRPGSRADSGRS